MVREIIQCECGQQLDKPLPRSCPACGANFVGVHRSYSHVFYAIFVILGLFAVLAGFVWMLLRIGN